MALRKEYLESLGLEIARKKYYNASRVEDVIEDFGRRTAALQNEKAALQNEKTALEKENASLNERVAALACGREEIGDAILSAKVISQQLITEAKERADAILAEAREEAARLTAEAEEKAREKSADFESRGQQAFGAMQDGYLRLRAECLDAVRRLDDEWQRFLSAFGEGKGEREEALPGDLADKLGEIAQSLGEIAAEDAEE